MGGAGHDEHAGPAAACPPCSPLFVYGFVPVVPRAVREGRRAEGRDLRVHVDDVPIDSQLKIETASGIGTRRQPWLALYTGTDG